MMQNSQFLVAQTSPAKNTPTSNSPKQAREEGESFKQVLSKQVEQEKAPTKKTVDKPSEASVGDEAKQVSLNDTPVDMDAKKELQALSVEPEADNAKEIVINAQLLASTETAKTVHDATDGKVALGAAKALEMTQPALANLTPNMTQEAATLASVATARLSVESEENIAQIKQPPVNVSLEEAVEDQVSTGKEDLKRDALVEKNQLVNHKLANYLAVDKHTRTSSEASASQAVSGLTEAAPISTIPLQIAPKVASLPLASIEQVGFSNVINTPPGKAGWSEAIGQKVVWMVGAAEQSATLTLNPKDLGPLQVVIHVNNEKADATFITENPEVRKALEEGMSNLRQSMGQAGVELGQASVNTSKQHQEFQQASKELSTKQENGDSTADGADITGHASPNTRVSNGLVDTFA